MRGLDHINIIELVDSYEDDEYICLVMDLMAGDLRNIMVSCDQPFDEDTTKKLFHQILLSVHYCHRRGIVHRDIKLENFFLDFDQESQLVTVKLGDFGVAKVADRGKKIYGLNGTLSMMAPEVINGVSYTEKADCWSLGVLLFEMLTNKHPYYS